jgi:hypothetical protein
MDNTLQINNIGICEEYVRQLQLSKYLEAAKRLHLESEIVYLITKGYIIKIVGESKEVSDKFLQVNELNLADIFEHIKVLEGRKRKLADSENTDSLDNWAGWQSYLIDIIEFLKNYKVNIE